MTAAIEVLLERINFLERELRLADSIHQAMAAERDLFLEKIARQQARVDELLADNTKQIDKRRAADERVLQLESEVMHKTHRIEDLESLLDPQPKERA